jgi:hypothetical protein
MPRLYSQRMLNPFHGIVNIAEIEGADGICRDGVNWTLYIQGAKEATDFADGVQARVSLPGIKFGTWSEKTGLHRAPVRFVTDYDQLDALGCRLLSLVKNTSEQVPFPLRDLYELWLLEAGADALPLALLESSCDPITPEPAEPLRWTAGQAARSSFRSDQNDTQASHTPAADRLTHQVNAAAGPVPRTQWFHRQPDGSGRGLSCSLGVAYPSGRVLPSAAFPELLLRETRETSIDRDLVRAHLAWQAPWLLALQGLGRSRRSQLEKDACKRALLVSELYLTYPEIIDEAAIKAARVEAKLRLASSGGKEQEGGPATTFFVPGN